MKRWIYSAKRTRQGRECRHDHARGAASIFVGEPLDMNPQIVDMHMARDVRHKQGVGEQIFNCLTGPGYFHVTNSGIQDEHVAQLYARFREFVALPEHAKGALNKLVRFAPKWISTYLPPSTEQLDYASAPEDKEVLEFWTEGGYNTDYILTLLKCDAVVCEGDIWSQPHLASMRSQPSACSGPHRPP
jgi:hypothetical protein